MSRLFRLGGPAVLLTVLTLSGCSDEPPAEPDPSAPPTSTDAGGPSEEATPEGEVMDLPTATLALPGKGWKVEDGLLDSYLQARRGPVGVTFNDFGDNSAVDSPRVLARLFRKTFDAEGVHVTYDAELGGEPAFEMTGGGVEAQYAYGAGHLGRAASLVISLPDRGEAAERRVVDEILAGFEWR